MIKKKKTNRKRLFWMFLHSAQSKSVKYALLCSLLDQFAPCHGRIIPLLHLWQVLNFCWEKFPVRKNLTPYVKVNLAKMSPTWTSSYIREIEKSFAKNNFTGSCHNYFSLESDICSGEYNCENKVSNMIGENIFIWVLVVAVVAIVWKQ